MKSSVSGHLLILLVVCTFGPLLGYRIVRVEDGSAGGAKDPLNGKIFLLNHGEASVIHHNETVLELGYGYDPSLPCVAVGAEGIHSWRPYIERIPKLNGKKVCIDTVNVSTVSSMRRGHPVPMLHHDIDNLDEALKWEMKKIDVIQGQMVFDKTFINWMINPSVLIWRGHLVVATGITWQIRSAPGMLPAGKHPSETIEFGILNISTLSGPPLKLKNPIGNIGKGTRRVYPINETYMGLRGQVDRLNHIVGGQDPRGFVIDDRHIGFVFTDRFEFRIRMSLAILSVNMTESERKTWCENSDMEVLRNFPTGYLNDGFDRAAEDFFKRQDNRVPYGGFQNEDGSNVVVSHLFREFVTRNTRKDEKNWSPFVHRESPNGTRRLLMIESIQPLVVVEPVWKEADISSGKVPVREVSHAQVAYDTSFWNHGGLRGGTNAILIDNSYYLAFFHSSATIPGDGIFKSYFMGAYTFTKTMPFQLMAVSALPFMDEDLYQGYYAEIERRNYDYVVFPMTLDQEDGDTLFLSFGTQDRYGMLGRLSLSAVLRTLVPARKDNPEIYPGHNFSAY